MIIVICSTHIFEKMFFIKITNVRGCPLISKHSHPSSLSSMVSNPLPFCNSWFLRSSRVQIASEASLRGQDVLVQFNTFFKKLKNALRVVRGENVWIIESDALIIPERIVASGAAAIVARTSHRAAAKCTRGLRKFITAIQLFMTLLLYSGYECVILRGVRCKRIF